MASKRFITNKIGFMQGRLVPSEKKNRIQYFPEKNWEKEILIAKKNNYKRMEWTVNVENIEKNPIMKLKEIKNIKKYLKKNKVKVDSVTCDFFMQQPFFKNPKYKKTLPHLKKIIINGQRMGIKLFVVPLVDQSSIKNIIQEDLLVKKMTTLKNLLKKNSKIIFEIDYEPNKIIKFIKRFRSLKFGINYDTGNSAGIGYSFKDEKKYFKYVKNIHLKDKKKNSKTTRLGRGDFNFKLFFLFLKKIKYNGNFILQTARAKNNLDEFELNINREYIRKYI